MATTRNYIHVTRWSMRNYKNFHKKYNKGLMKNTKINLGKSPQKELPG